MTVVLLATVSQTSSARSQNVQVRCCARCPESMRKGKLTALTNSAFAWKSEYKPCAHVAYSWVLRKATVVGLDDTRSTTAQRRSSLRMTFPLVLPPSSTVVFAVSFPWEHSSRPVNNEFIIAYWAEYIYITVRCW